MPKSHLDWFGIASLWLGAALMAIKAAGLPLMQGAPIWLAANWWNYVPLLLLTLYLGIALYKTTQSQASLISSDRRGGKPNLEKPRNENYAHHRAIDSIKSAKLGISRTIGLRDNREVELKLHEVRAALLTSY